MPPQPSTSPDSRGPRSPLRNQARTETREDFCRRLNGRAVTAELDAIFRESPEFGRNLAARLAPFLDDLHSGDLNLIGAGGEAAVFGDPENQSAIKLSGPPARCNFGWIIRRQNDGVLTLAPGSLDEMLNRLALFESLFPTGLSIDCIGSRDDFLSIRQPFIVGHHPDEATLQSWMRGRGWQPFSGAALGETLNNLSWQRDQFLATDVRPENALVSEASGDLFAIDFIVAGRELS